MAILEKPEKELGMYETHLEKQWAKSELLKTRDLIKLKRAHRNLGTEIHLDPGFLAEIYALTESLDVKNELDQDNLKVKEWLKNGKIEDLQFGNWNITSN